MCLVYRLLGLFSLGDITDHADQRACPSDGRPLGADLHGEGAAVLAPVDRLKEDAPRVGLGHLSGGQPLCADRAQVLDRQSQQFIAAVAVGAPGGGIGFQNAPIVAAHKEDNVPAVVRQ